MYSPFRQSSGIPMSVGSKRGYRVELHRILQETPSPDYGSLGLTISHVHHHFTFPNQLRASFSPIRARGWNIRFLMFSLKDPLIVQEIKCWRDHWKWFSAFFFYILRLYEAARSWPSEPVCRSWSPFGDTWTSAYTADPRRSKSRWKLVQGSKNISLPPCPLGK